MMGADFIEAVIDIKNDILVLPKADRLDRPRLSPGQNTENPAAAQDTGRTRRSSFKNRNSFVVPDSTGLTIGGHDDGQVPMGLLVEPTPATENQIVQGMLIASTGHNRSRSNSNNRSRSNSANHSRSRSNSNTQTSASMLLKSAGSVQSLSSAGAVDTPNSAESVIMGLMGGGGI